MRFDQLKRRDFITLLGGAAVAWPLAGRAEQPGKLPTIGFLGAKPSIESHRVAAFVQRLRELTWIDGRNLAIEYRWAEGRNERYAENAADASVLEMREAQATARTRGLEIITSEIRRAEDIAPAFEVLRDRADALYLCPDPLMNTNRTRINILAVGARLPTMYGGRQYVEAGGLMSYGANLPNQFRRVADFVDKILRGAKPADIPVEQPTKFDLIINLTAAKALGLDIPPTLLARADEVIE
jgi:hypothetical protein